MNKIISNTFLIYKVFNYLMNIINLNIFTRIEFIYKLNFISA